MDVGVVAPLKPGNVGAARAAVMGYNGVSKAEDRTRTSENNKGSFVKISIDEQSSAAQTDTGSRGVTFIYNHKY